jgi:hypothetical protein
MIRAHGILRTGPCAVAGEHLVPANETVQFGELTESDLAEIDASYHLKKTSGGLTQASDERAVAAQVMDLDAMRRAGWL